MKLQTKQLRQFNSIVGNIVPNKVLPILSYLKFEDGFITKNNLESFVTMEADFKGKCLIDEKILMSIVNATSEEEIDVEVNGKSMTLKYGAKKTVAPTDDILLFPQIEVASINRTEISKEVINEIKMALNFTQENENVPYTGCVFVGRGIVAACNNFIAYTKAVDKKLPDIIIEKNTANVIKNFDTVSFSESNSYQFYSNHVFNFGFIKKDINFVDMNLFTKIPEAETVVVNKKEIIEFCEVCTNSCMGRPITASVNGNLLSMVDSAYEIDQKHPLSVSLNEFSFNPSLMLKMLKSLPDEKLNFIRGKDRYCITGASGFVSLIMEMKPNN